MTGYEGISEVGFTLEGPHNLLRESGFCANQGFGTPLKSLESL